MTDPLNGQEGREGYGAIAASVRRDIHANRQGIAVYAAFDRVHDQLDDVCRSLVGAQARSRHGHYNIVANEAATAIAVIEEEVLPTLRNLKAKANRLNNKRQAQAREAAEATP